MRKSEVQNSLLFQTCNHRWVSKVHDIDGSTLRLWNLWAWIWSYRFHQAVGVPFLRYNFLLVPLNQGWICKFLQLRRPSQAWVSSKQFHSPHLHHVWSWEHFDLHCFASFRGIGKFFSKDQKQSSDSRSDLAHNWRMWSMDPVLFPPDNKWMPKLCLAWPYQWNLCPVQSEFQHTSPRIVDYPALQNKPRPIYRRLDFLLLWCIGTNHSVNYWHYCSLFRKILLWSPFRLVGPIYWNHLDKDFSAGSDPSSLSRS